MGCTIAPGMGVMPAAGCRCGRPPDACPAHRAPPRPQAVVARLEVCMRELGLSLTPPPAVDFDSVPLERLLPVRTPRGGGGGTLASHQVGRPVCRVLAPSVLC